MLLRKMNPSLIISETNSFLESEYQDLIQVVGVIESRGPDWTSVPFLKSVFLQIQKRSFAQAPSYSPMVIALMAILTKYPLRYLLP